MIKQDFMDKMFLIDTNATGFDRISASFSFALALWIIQLNEMYTNQSGIWIAFVFVFFLIYTLMYGVYVLVYIQEVSFKKPNEDNKFNYVMLNLGYSTFVIVPFGFLLKMMVGV